MKIIFHENFLDPTYAPNNASNPERMKSVYDAVQASPYERLRPVAAMREEILLAHTPRHVEAIAGDRPFYEMALLAAGSAISASEVAMKGEPAFACVRPPGHHASRDGSWGYCAFNNIALALLRLKAQGRIESAFVLDFDAHTGDGTVDVLAGWKEAQVFNPYAEGRDDYLKRIAECLADSPPVDVIAVSAGFDTYEFDLGKKLKTEDFETIGKLLRDYSRRQKQWRRFAVLEGGYYFPDLGKNVLAFCKGFE